MFKVKRYQEEPSVVLKMMQDNPFVIVTGFGADGYPVATHIPVEVVQRADGKIIISGHFSRATDHAKAFAANTNALLIFTGPHAYVSASWYTDTRMASTWNYITVHVKGRLQFLDDAGTYNIIKALTDRYEAASANPASMEKMSEKYIRDNLKAIVGFEIEVQHIDNVFKLSQNRDAASQEHIIENLSESKEAQAIAIAAEMQKRQKRQKSIKKTGNI
jgi:transcriptional regulator